MPTDAEWQEASDRLDVVHRARLGIAPVDPDAPEAPRRDPFERARFGRPGLFIRPGAAEQYPLELLQRRLAIGERTDELYAAIAEVTR